MAGFVIRRRLTALDASDLIDRAREFFTANRRRRVFLVGDDHGPWFKVRRAHILNDIAAHSQSGCPVCGSLNVEATKEGLLFCYKCAVNKMIAARQAEK